MNKRFYLLMAFLVLILAVMACAIPSGNGGNQPSASDQVATVVASTLQALTPVVVDTATTMPPPPGLLPHTLYFMNNDNAGIVQVYRLEVDAKTIKQITFEPSAVSSYDVSLANGSVAYVANNQLLLINSDGSGRHMLADGGAIDANNPFVTSLSSPVFSPNGETIAYSFKGLNLIAVSTGVSNLVLEKKSDSGTPAEMYIPQKYSPDGSKLLLTVAIPNSDGSSAGIFYTAAKSLIRLNGDGARICCSAQTWAPDSSSLYAASSTVGFFASGLWRADPATGNLTTLLPTEAGGGAYNLAAFPYPAPDGNLYFFYNTAPNPNGVIDRPLLQMVRTAVDGVTGRAILRPETFQLLNEALWAPDASFVITATAPIQDVVQGGNVELYYTKGQQSMVPLLQFGMMLKWGP